MPRRAHCCGAWRRCNAPAPASVACHPRLPPTAQACFLVRCRARLLAEIAMMRAAATKRRRCPPSSSAVPAACFCAWRRVKPTLSPQTLATGCPGSMLIPHLSQPWTPFWQTSVPMSPSPAASSSWQSWRRRPAPACSCAPCPFRRRRTLQRLTPAWRACSLKTRCAPATTTGCPRCAACKTAAQRRWKPCAPSCGWPPLRRVGLLGVGVRAGGWLAPSGACQVVGRLLV